MSLKHPVAATLFGSVLASLPAPAQENAPYKTEMDFEASLLSSKFVPTLPEESPLDLAAYEEYQFVQRIHALSRALRDFAAAYRDSQIDLKKVKAVRKAMQDLEKSDWFRPSKAK
jgi:hypothetical protein